ncbi:MAG: hypothetical protein Q7T26_11490 [Dehalococcoidia bacterium]|nr:hypothetical protein [Dehalococcoidia bacterium]
MSAIATPGRYYVLNPEGVPQTKAEDSRLSPRVADLRGKTVGMVDDGACGAFMHHLGEVIEQRFPGAKARYWRKPSLSKPAPPELIDEVSKNVDIAIVGACV